MRIATTMALLVIIAPFLYLALLQRNPHSFWVKNFIWIVVILLLGVLLSGLLLKKGR